MKRALRWVRRFVLTLLALLVVAIGVVLIALHTAWGRDYLRGKIESALQDQFPGGARVGELDGSVLGELVLRDVEIDGTDHRPQYTVKTLRVRLALLPLVHKTARIDELVAEDVAVDVRSQRPPPPRPPSPPSEPSWSVELPHVEVHRGTIAIAGAEPVHLDGLELAGELHVPAGEPISGWASATCAWRERRAPISAVVAGSIDHGTFRVPLAAIAVGGVRLSAAGVTIDGEISGVFTGRGSPEAVAALAPGIDIPGEAELLVEARPGEPIRVTAMQGDATLRGALRVDPRGKRVTGVVVGTTVAIETFTKGKLAGMGVALVAGELAWEHLDVRGGAIAMGIVDGKSGGAVAALGELVGDRGHAVGFGGAPGNTRALAFADLARGPGTLAIADATLVAATADAKAASELSPAAGSFAATVHAKGALRPTVDLDLDAKISGNRVRYTAEGEDVAASAIAATIRSATHVPRDPIVDGRVEADGIVRNATALGWLAIDGKNTRDGKLDLAIHARPASAKLRANVRAFVHAGWLALLRKEPGAKLVADLGDHDIRADSGVTFAGRGGQITVDDKLVALRELRSSGGGGQIVVSGELHRDTQDLDAKLDATKIATSMIDPQYRGSVTGNAAIHRRGGRWGGTATVTGTGIATAPDQPAFDADARASIDGRRVQLDAGARNLMLGAATVAVDVTGPRDVFDREAWRRVSRTDIRAAKLTANRVDLGGVGHVFAGNDKLSGVADGELAIGPDGVRGSIRVHGVHAKSAGDADAVVTIDPGDRGELAAKAKLKVADVSADATARVALPDHLFDPGAWRTAGRAMLRDGTVELAETAFDPKLLAKLGIDQPIRGRAAAKITIAAAASSARIVADVRDAQGGALAKPVTVHVEAVADGRGTCADAEVTSIRAKGKPVAPAATRCAGFVGVAATPETLDLLAIHGELPLTIDRWFATDLPRLLVTPVTGSVTLPPTSLPDLLAVVNRRDITAGVIDGSIAVQGTIGTPTVPPSTLTVRGLEVPAGTSATPPRLDVLTITARWGGVAGQIDAIGRESDGGTLTAHADGRPDAPGSVTAWLQVDKFDVAPVAVFLPGPLVGAGGRLNGRVDLRGLDPRTGDLHGDVVLSDARIPLSATVGTVRRGTLNVSIRDRKIAAKLDGKLGGGSVHVDGALRLAGILPDSIDAKAQLRRIIPIGTLEPIIDADVHAVLTRTGKRWTGPIEITHGNVVVPESHGKKLLSAGVPPDLVIADKATPPDKIRLDREPPRDPWIVADVDLETTEVRSEIFRGAVSGAFKLLVGDTIALDGSISTERGDVDILGRRYRIEHAVANFPSSLDPNLDIEIIHEFPEVELVADIRSPLSALLASPLKVIQTRTDPAIYTADQRLAFLLGGEPGGDPNTQSRDAAAAASASVFSAYAQRYLKRVLPFDLGITLSYQPSTATSSASYTAGRWLSDKFFVGVRRHTEVRLDENTNEFTIEYYLGKRWLLDGMGGDRGYYGGDLLWRKRY